MPVKGRRSRPLLLEGGGNSHMRLAMIGCGAIARAHAAAIEVLPGVELAAVVDNDGEALSKAESELEAPGFGSVDELVAAQIADAACIGTWFHITRKLEYIQPAAPINAASSRHPRSRAKRKAPVPARRKIAAELQVRPQPTGSSRLKRVTGW